MSELLKQTEHDPLENTQKADMKENPAEAPVPEASPVEEMPTGAEPTPAPGKEPATEVTKAAAPPGKSTVERAREKLEAERAKATQRGFAGPIISYLLQRCEEDAGMAADVAQSHKTWSKCFDYIKNQARKLATNGVAAVEDQTVYEWAEDYYHLDDKAQAEKVKKKQATKAAEAPSKKAGTASGTEKSKKPALKPAKEPIKEVTKKPERKERAKKTDKTMAGQMSLFDFL